MTEMLKVFETNDGSKAVSARELHEHFGALCLFATCTMLQFNNKLNGANSTKPLLCVVAV